MAKLNLEKLLAMEDGIYTPTSARSFSMPSPGLPKSRFPQTASSPKRPLRNKWKPIRIIPNPGAKKKVNRKRDRDVSGADDLRDPQNALASLDVAQGLQVTLFASLRAGSKEPPRFLDNLTSVMLPS